MSFLGCLFLVLAGLWLILAPSVKWLLIALFALFVLILMKPGFFSSAKSGERAHNFQNVQDVSQRTAADGTPKTESKDNPPKTDSTPKTSSKDSPPKTDSTPKTSSKNSPPKTDSTPTGSSRRGSTPRAGCSQYCTCEEEPPLRVPPHPSRFRKSSGLPPFEMHGEPPPLMPSFMNFLSQFDPGMHAHMQHPG
eukprot:1155970-Pelagomonas_calceolata.AAC.2